MICSLVSDKHFLLPCLNLAENIRQALDEGYIGCGIFVDLQIAFHSVDHEMLLWLWACGNTFCCSSGFYSGVRVLEPLLFLLHINDLNEAIILCKVYHFADDTYLLYLGKSIKKPNKLLILTYKIGHIGSMPTKFHLMLKNQTGNL